MATLIYNDFKQYNEENKLQSKKTEYTFLPWVEKFRPEKLNDIISNEQIINTFKDYVKNKYLPHLLICGPSGVGKTSIVMALAKELYGESYMLMTKHINASEERGIEVIRNKVKDFVMASIFLPNVIPFKLVILDEADAMTISAQGMLRRIIEDFTSSARFCLICNKLKSIDPAIQSRCVNFRFAPLQPLLIKKRINEICLKQKIKIDSDGVDLLIKISGGDMRKVFNNLQSIYMAFNSITYDSVAQCTGYPTDDQIDLILTTLLNKPLNISLITITNIIQENQYSLLDIITEISLKLRTMFLNNKITHKKFSKIILNLKLIEENILISLSEPIAIASFVAAFY
jgi:replication factor C subunit 3/5